MAKEFGAAIKPKRREARHCLFARIDQVPVLFAFARAPFHSQAILGVQNGFPIGGSQPSVGKPMPRLT